MRGSRIKDERIITEIQKFSTHRFMIVFVGFLVSLFVKVYLSDLREAGQLDIAKSIMSTLVGSVIFFIGITWMQWFIIKKSNKNADKNLNG
ncbi:hypothetical protein [Paenibacillus etheri]|uniref:Uncharacterized protein n=1 Tax=Paenibacillus etheri TaxID=1306852 RepID=A0A0W1AYZ7_9BACL|nr:hypothetical protein [Paenibacillus etheri]KTD86567.1 hypothetical protein UQ64_13955 [Paenibacillus etheri]